MESGKIIQGRCITKADMGLIRHLLAENPGWNRSRLACMLFGSAAWKVKSRDEFIGWDRSCRERNLSGLTNHTRFLILPWVRVPHLASHLLSRICRDLAGLWMEKYAHPIHLIETFVERDRFRGTCYRAAGWRHAGSTTGCSRNDTDQTLKKRSYHLQHNFGHGKKHLSSAGFACKNPKLRLRESYRLALSA